MKIIKHHNGNIQVIPDDTESIKIIPGPGSLIEMANKAAIKNIKGDFVIVSVASPAVDYYDKVHIFCHQRVPEGGGSERTYSASFYPFNGDTVQTVGILAYLKGLTFERALSLCRIFDVDFDFTPHLEPCDLQFVNCCPIEDETEDYDND